MDYHRGDTLVAQRTYAYTYNNRSELIGDVVDGTGLNGWDYDNIGNRLVQQQGSACDTYTSNQLNQYTAIEDETHDVFTPTYDDDGNQTRIKTSTGIWDVTYNAKNRPVLFSKEGEDLTVACTYDYMGRRATKVVAENGVITTSHRFLYRGYLQIDSPPPHRRLTPAGQHRSAGCPPGLTAVGRVACCDRKRSTHPCLWLITWDPTQPIAPRPLAIQKDGTWFAYGWDLTKNIWEAYTTSGYIGTAYTYTAYGQVTASGAVEQPIQWSSEYNDAEMGMVYYNYRHYVCRQGLFSSRDAKKGIYPQMHPYKYSHNQPMHIFDHLGMDVFVRNTPAALYFHWKICVSEWELAPAGYKGISCCWKKQRYVKKDTFYCIGFGPHMKHEMWPSCRGVDDTESRHPYGNPVNGGTPMPPEMKNVNGEGANGVVTTNNAVTDRETGKPGHLQDIKTSCA